MSLTRRWKPNLPEQTATGDDKDDDHYSHNKQAIINGFGNCKSRFSFNFSTFACMRNAENNLPCQIAGHISFYMGKLK